MAHWRRGLIVRFVVIALLLWTGADLTNASLCALEREESVSFAIGGDDTVAADVSVPGPVAPSLPHIDDCFCCSHCVEVQALFPDLLAGPAAAAFAAAAPGEPRHFGNPLYHPPLV